MSSTNPYAAPQRKMTAKAVEPEQETLEVPHGTISEVLAWVEDDKERAEAALAVEKDGAKRVTLISALEDILDK